MNNKDVFDEKWKKKLPYKVPADFFETITEETLRLAKKQLWHRKIKYLVGYSSAAVLLIAVLFYAVLNTNGLQKEGQIASDSRAEEQIPRIADRQPLPDSSLFHFLLSEEEAADTSFLQGDEDAEKVFGDLFATLTEEELQVLAETISTELYLNELMEE
jgi:hypothetical protein